jgi:hypothetical protein
MRYWKNSGATLSSILRLASRVSAVVGRRPGLFATACAAKPDTALSSSS